MQEEQPAKDEETTDNNNNVCAGCLNVLDDEEIISALGQEWHMECFRCSACDAALSNWYFEKDGLLFCKDDYWTRYGEACQQCSQIITGPVMVAGEHKFHPECFCCGSCGAFIGDGDSYALVERSKLYCGQCYKRQMQPLKRNRLAFNSRKPHSIRLVEIPGGQKGIKLTQDNSTNNGSSSQCFTISEIIWKLHGKLLQLAFAFLTSAFNICCHFLPNNSRLEMNDDLMSLHIGDKILEINGAPVKDTAIENVENLLRYSSDTVLQLTIEHDPETISKTFPKLKLATTDLLPTLTQTSSDTNIPTINITSNSNFGSTNSIETTSTTTNEENIVNNNNNTTTTTTINNKINKERLFKRRDEGYMSGTRSRQLLRRKQQNLIINEKPQTLDKERSSSMSRLLDDTHINSKRCLELSRAYSFLEANKPQQRVFRASDLVKGELLGQGFFGQVYKVTTRDTCEVMVLKELYRVDDEAQKNFLKEVAVLRNLNHINVLRFIGVLYKEQRLHLVTEYISGGTLTELIHNYDKQLPWEQRVSFAKDITAGMSYLHSMNIIHRDLNSHNCLVRDDKTVIVADFGLARIISRYNYNTNSTNRQRINKSNSNNINNNDNNNSSSNNNTNSIKRQERKKRYTVVGNPYWMAPEMMKGNKYDEKVDIFSFGIILCEIIGRVLADPDFLPRSNDFGLNQLTFKEKFCNQCPEAFYKIAFLCTDLNPDKRPPFEVIEVWLESLSMHLSVDMPLPPDLLFDIQNYRGLLSPSSSSGSTTPDNVSNNGGQRSPVLLEPIKETKLLSNNNNNNNSTVGSGSNKNTVGSTDEGVIKVTVPTTEIEINKKFPDYENIDFICGSSDDRTNCDNKRNTKTNLLDSNDKLITVKDRIRNLSDNNKNLSLKQMNLKTSTTLPTSKVTQKFVNNKKLVIEKSNKLFNNNNNIMPDIISSTLFNKSKCTTNPITSSSFSISRNIFELKKPSNVVLTSQQQEETKKDTVGSRLVRKRFNNSSDGASCSSNSSNMAVSSLPKRTPILQKKRFHQPIKKLSNDSCASTSSTVGATSNNRNSLVRDIVDNFNRKERSLLNNQRFDYGRSSLRVNSGGSSSSSNKKSSLIGGRDDNEFTAL